MENQENAPIEVLEEVGEPSGLAYEPESTDLANSYEGMDKASSADQVNNEWATIQKIDLLTRTAKDLDNLLIGKGHAKPVINTEDYMEIRSTMMKCLKRVDELISQL